MNTQQAPSGLQASRLSPLQVAWTIAQSTNGGTVKYRNTPHKIVIAILSGDESRLTRSHSVAGSRTAMGGFTGVKAGALIASPAPSCGYRCSSAPTRKG